MHSASRPCTSLTFSIIFNHEILQLMASSFKQKRDFLSLDIKEGSFVLCWTNWSPTVTWHQASTHFWHWTVKSHLEQGTRDVMIHAQLRFPVLINLWKTVSYIINESFLQDYILAVLFCKLKSLGHLFSQHTVSSINHGICHGHLNLKLLLPKIAVATTVAILLCS